MNWYKVTLSPADISAWRHSRLQEDFQKIFTLCNPPKDAGFAMFALNDTTEYVYLFSPPSIKAAEALLRIYGGVPCEAPRRSEVHIMVGHDDTRPVTFAPED